MHSGWSPGRMAARRAAQSRHPANGVDLNDRLPPHPQGPFQNGGVDDPDAAYHGLWERWVDHFSGIEKASRFPRCSGLDL